MAVRTGGGLGGFMSMLEQATRRGHELDSKGYSDVRVGGGVSGSSKKTAESWSGVYTDKEYKASFDKGSPFEKEGFFQKPLDKEEWVAKRWDQDAQVLGAPVVPVQVGPVLAVMSDPVELPEYLLDDLTDQAERAVGGSSGGGW